MLKKKRFQSILAVCSYYVTYTFQSGSILYSCLNVKELLVRNRWKIWSLSDCNWIRAYNHLVRKPTLNHLAKYIINNIKISDSDRENSNEKNSDEENSDEENSDKETSDEDTSDEKTSDEEC